MNAKNAPFSAKLNEISELKRASVREKRRLREAKFIETEKIREQHEADRLEFIQRVLELESDITSKLLVSAWAGGSSVDIDLHDKFLCCHDLSEKFIFSPSLDKLRRAKHIARVQVPRKLDLISCEFLKLPDLLRDSVRSGLRGIDFSLSPDISRAVESARILSASFDPLGKIKDNHNLSVKIKEDKIGFNVSRKARLNDRLRKIQPCIVELFEEHRKSLAAHVLSYDGSRDAFHRGRSEIFFRSLLSRRFPDLNWSEESISKAELRLLVEASSRGLSIGDTIDILPKDSFPGNAIEIQEISAAEKSLSSSLWLDLSKEFIGSELFDDVKVNVQNLVKTIDRLCNWCRSVLGHGKLYDLVFSGNEVFYFPVMVSVSRSNPIFQTVEFLLSSVGRRAVNALQDQLEGRASRGFKSLNYVLNLIDSNVVLKSGKSPDIIFVGTVDYYLSLWNHADGLGLGYEYTEKKSGNHSLKLFWG